jgi:hypothetical protein
VTAQAGPEAEKGISGKAKGDEMGRADAGLVNS